MGWACMLLLAMVGGATYFGGRWTLITTWMKLWVPSSAALLWLMHGLASGHQAGTIWPQTGFSVGCQVCGSIAWMCPHHVQTCLLCSGTEMILVEAMRLWSLRRDYIWLSAHKNSLCESRLCHTHSPFCMWPLLFLLLHHVVIQPGVFAGGWFCLLDLPAIRIMTE